MNEKKTFLSNSSGVFPGMTPCIKSILPYIFVIKFLLMLSDSTVAWCLALLPQLK